MSTDNYNERKNTTVLKCWVITVLVIFIYMLVKFLMSNLSLNLLVCGLLLMVTSLVITYCMYKDIGRSNLNIKYLFVLEFILLNYFILFNLKDFKCLFIILPILSVLIVYNDIKLIRSTYLCVIATDSIRLIFIIINKENKDTELLFLLLSVLFICMLFSIFLISINSLEHDKLVELNNEVLKDDLTKLYNRKFLSLLDYSDTVNISLAVIDIDNFKAFNDTYGHKFGDLILQKVSKVLKDSISDLSNVYAIRLGGDEFVIYSINLDYDILEERCNLICNRISSLALEYNSSKVDINVSIGIASNKSFGCDDYDELFLRADSNLYKAKNNGKNTVVK